MDHSTLMEPLQAVMLDEFTDWLNTRGATQHGCGHGCAQPRSITGLPAGWSPTAHRCAPERDCCFTLARRGAGGWALVRTSDQIMRTSLMRATPGLDDLYASVRWRPAKWVAGPRPTARTTQRLASGPYPLLSDWLGTVIIAMYDPRDPTEEAARVLFALSGDLRRVPKAAA